MAVSPKDVWDALLAAGASSVQAAGIMGNMIHESGLNPEAYNPADSNGAPSIGLVQWNTASYPGAQSLRTGNPAADLAAQIRFLAQTGGFRAASGATASEAGGNFAASYERCAACSPGGSEYSARAASAATVAQWAASGSWPQSAGSPGAGGGAGGGGDTLTAAADDPSCAATWPKVAFFGGGCIMHKPAARHIMGGALIVAGGLVAAPGVLILAAYGFRTSGTQRAVTQAAEVVPGARPAAELARSHARGFAAYLRS